MEPQAAKAALWWLNSLIAVPSALLVNSLADLASGEVLCSVTRHLQDKHGALHPETRRSSIATMQDALRWLSEAFGYSSLPTELSAPGTLDRIRAGHPLTLVAAVNFLKQRLDEVDMLASVGTPHRPLSAASLLRGTAGGGSGYASLTASPARGVGGGGVVGGRQLAPRSPLATGTPSRCRRSVSPPTPSASGKGQVLFDIIYGRAGGGERDADGSDGTLWQCAGDSYRSSGIDGYSGGYEMEPPVVVASPPRVRGQSGGTRSVTTGEGSLLASLLASVAPPVPLGAGAPAPGLPPRAAVLQVARSARAAGGHGASAQPQTTSGFSAAAGVGDFTMMVDGGAVAGHGAFGALGGDHAGLMDVTALGGSGMVGLVPPPAATAPVAAQPPTTGVADRRTDGAGAQQYHRLYQAALARVATAHAGVEARGLASVDGSAPLPSPPAAHAAAQPFQPVHHTGLPAHPPRHTDAEAVASGPPPEIDSPVTAVAAAFPSGLRGGDAAAHHQHAFHRRKQAAGDLMQAHAPPARSGSASRGRRRSMPQQPLSAEVPRPAWNSAPDVPPPPYITSAVHAPSTRVEHVPPPPVPVQSVPAAGRCGGAAPCSAAATAAAVCAAPGKDGIGLRVGGLCDPAYVSKVSIAPQSTPLSAVAAAVAFGGADAGGGGRAMGAGLAGHVSPAFDGSAARHSLRGAGSPAAPLNTTAHLPQRAGGVLASDFAWPTADDAFAAAPVRAAPPLAPPTDHDLMWGLSPKQRTLVHWLTHHLGIDVLPQHRQAYCGVSLPASDPASLPLVTALPLLMADGILLCEIVAAVEARIGTRTPTTSVRVHGPVSPTSGTGEPQNALRSIQVLPGTIVPKLAAAAGSHRGPIAAPLSVTACAKNVGLALALLRQRPKVNPRYLWAQDAIVSPATDPHGALDGTLVVPAFPAAPGGAGDAADSAGDLASITWGLIADIHKAFVNATTLSGGGGAVPGPATAAAGSSAAPTGRPSDVSATISRRTSVGAPHSTAVAKPAAPVRGSTVVVGDARRTHAEAGLPLPVIPAGQTVVSLPAHPLPPPPQPKVTTASKPYEPPPPPRPLPQPVIAMPHPRVAAALQAAGFEVPQPSLATAAAPEASAAEVGPDAAPGPHGTLRHSGRHPSLAVAQRFSGPLATAAVGDPRGSSSSDAVLPAGAALATQLRSSVESPALAAAMTHHEHVKPALDLAATCTAKDAAAATAGAAASGRASAPPASRLSKMLRVIPAPVPIPADVLPQLPMMSIVTRGGIDAIIQKGVPPAAPSARAGATAEEDDAGSGDPTADASAVGKHPIKPLSTDRLREVKGWLRDLGVTGHLPANDAWLKGRHAMENPLTNGTLLVEVTRALEEETPPLGGSAPARHFVKPKSLPEARANVEAVLATLRASPTATGAVLVELDLVRSQLEQHTTAPRGGSGGGAAMAVTGRASLGATRGAAGAASASATSSDRSRAKSPTVVKRSARSFTARVGTSAPCVPRHLLWCGEEILIGNMDATWALLSAMQEVYSWARRYHEFERAVARHRDGAPSNPGHSPGDEVDADGAAPAGSLNATIVPGDDGGGMAGTLRGSGTLGSSTPGRRVGTQSVRSGSLSSTPGRPAGRSRPGTPLGRASTATAGALDDAPAPRTAAGSMPLAAIVGLPPSRLMGADDAGGRAVIGSAPSSWLSAGMRTPDRGRAGMAPASTVTTSTAALVAPALSPLEAEVLTWLTRMGVQVPGSAAVPGGLPFTATSASAAPAPVTMEALAASCADGELLASVAAMLRSGRQVPGIVLPALTDTIARHNVRRVLDALRSMPGMSLRTLNLPTLPTSIAAGDPAALLDLLIDCKRAHAGEAPLSASVARSAGAHTPQSGAKVRIVSPDAAPPAAAAFAAGPAQLLARYDDVSGDSWPTPPAPGATAAPAAHSATTGADRQSRTAAPAAVVTVSHPLPGALTSAARWLGDSFALHNGAAAGAASSSPQSSVVSGTAGHPASVASLSPPTPPADPAHIQAQREVEVIIHWLETMGVRLDAPRQLLGDPSVSSSGSGAAAPCEEFADGTLLARIVAACENIGGGRRDGIPGIDPHPRTNAAKRGNIRKVLEVLRLRRTMPVDYLWSDLELRDGRPDVLRPFLLQIRKAYGGRA